jgi:hypothetical protein
MERGRLITIDLPIFLKMGTVHCYLLQNQAGFAIKPLWLAPSPAAPLAKTLRDAVQVNLDYKIQHQNPDGSWSPSWSLGGFYP